MKFIVTSLAALLLLASHPVFSAERAFLVLAHGSMPMSEGHGSEHHGGEHGHGGGGGDHDCAMHPTAWEQHVIDAVEKTRAGVPLPVGVAFGMWETECFQKEIDRLKLENPALRELDVVPL